MSSLNDYLAQKAKFYGPSATEPTGRSPSSSTTLSPNDIALLESQPGWRATAGYQNPHMVDDLCDALAEYLSHENLGLPMTDLDAFFQPIRERTALGRRRLIENNAEFVVEYDIRPNWRQLSDKPSVQNMIRDGVLNAISEITLLLLQHDIRLLAEASPDPNRGFTSLVDYLFQGKHGNVFMELKRPAVMNDALTLLDLPEFPIHLLPGGSTGQRVINKACLYMGAHMAHWLALTSHEKWVFLHFHNDPTAAYVTYSSIELQENNTRPFRALLAILLQAEGKLQFKSNSVPVLLRTLSQEKLSRRKGTSQMPASATDMHGQQDLPGRKTTRPADLMIGWSRQKVPIDKWTAYYAVHGTDRYSLLRTDTGTVLLRLHRLLGSGETGVVYEAKLGLDGGKEGLRSYAVKEVVKGKRQERKGTIRRLYNEFRMYGVIERARCDRRISGVAPCCYGLYESEYSYALIMDYDGVRLDKNNWESLTPSDKQELFKLILALHAIGIEHGDIQPQNVIRGADGCLRIIDFSESVLHECPSIIGEAPSYEFSFYGRNGAECAELKDVWEKLIGSHYLGADCLPCPRPP